MLIDGRLIPWGTPLRTDVVVVGAGPAGITIALELRAAGLDVALIESGGRAGERPDIDALSGRSAGEPFPLAGSRLRAFGGTSGLWQLTTGLRSRPLDEIDFAARPGRPDVAWPFGRSALEPYYRRAHRLVGLLDDYEPATWCGSTHPHALTWEGGPGLAMFQFAPHDTFIERFADLGSTPGIDLFLHSTVDEVELDDRVATGVRVATTGGGRFRVGGRAVVLAAGAIENARILLSSPGPSGGGIGNEHDNVGRYFMEHVSMDCGVLDTPIDRCDIELFGERTDGGRKSQPMLWLGDELIEREGLLNAAFWVFGVPPGYLSAGVDAARSLKAAIDARAPQRAVAPAARMALGAGGLARFAIGKAGRRPPTDVGLRILAEQLPHRDSRVDLLDERDALGMRRVRLDWRVTDDDLETVRRHRDTLAELLRRRGGPRFRDDFDPVARRSPLMSNHHHLGTTRMHTDPTLGVVDEHCRVHTTQGLFVSGSSVFPTGGYLNPTLTIIALAQRLADHLIAELSPATVPPSSPTTHAG